MTLLISWIGVDDKKEGKSVASLYIASDSRYSWGKSSKYDHGIKVFGSSCFPDIFGFCGDVLFPSIVLGQLIPQIDSGIIFNDSDDGDIKNKKVLNFFTSSIQNYPKEHLGGSFTILHGTRIGKDFKCFKTSYSQSTGFLNREIPLPEFSTKICSLGSGKSEFDDNFRTWNNDKHNNHRTSRGVYHCLNRTLLNIKDPHTGGKAQIVGLYRINNSRLFGIIEDKKRYVYGKESSEDILSSRIEWRNENFERMDPKNMELIADTQRQPI